MTDFISIFQPGMQHVREQRDLDKILVVEAPSGTPGVEPPDIDSGSITITPRPRETSVEE